MGIAFRAAASAFVTSGSTLTIDKPAGVVENDVMVASIIVLQDTTTTITPPAGWTLIPPQLDNDNGGTRRMAIYYKVAGGSEPGSYDWTFSQNVDGSGGIEALSGADPLDPTEIAGGATGSGTEAEAPSITTITSNTMLVGFFGIEASATWTPPGSMTERFDQNGPNSIYGPSQIEGTDEPFVGPGATGTRTATASSTGSWLAFLCAIKPAEGPSTFVPQIIVVN